MESTDLPELRTLARRTGHDFDGHWPGKATRTREVVESIRAIETFDSGIVP